MEFQNTTAIEIGPSFTMSTASTMPAESTWIPILETIYWTLSYLWYIPTVFGLPGNLMSFLVTMRRDNRRISTSIYMAALSVVDTMTLIAADSIVITFQSPIVKRLLGPDIGRFLEFAYYFNYTFGITSGMFLMEMSIDRLIVVRFPLAAKTLCTTTRARWTVLFTLLIVAGLNSNVLFIYKYKYDATTKVESVEPNVNGSPALEMFGSMFQLIFGTLVPFAVILVANIWIIITVKKASQKQNQMTEGRGQHAQGHDKRKQETGHLTRMLLLVSGAYVVCSIPFRVYETVFEIPALKDMYHDFDDVYWYMRYKVGYSIFANIWVFNYAVNFYLYCIGGKKFRNDAFQIYKSLFRNGGKT